MTQPTSIRDPARSHSDLASYRPVPAVKMAVFPPILQIGMRRALLGTHASREAYARMGTAGELEGS
jgi:hypothetical protein